MSVQQDRPPSVGYKFDPEGTALSFPGNTIICAIDPVSRFYKVLMQVHDALQASPYRCKIAVLPPASYHVTIFNGADDLHRSPPLWPNGLVVTAAMIDCHDFVEKRLDSFSLGCALPFRLRLAPCDSDNMLRTLRLELQPADQAEDDKLRHLRDRLADATGIRSPAHDRYRFHLSLAYVIDWLDPAETRDYTRLYSNWKCLIEAAAPVIDLDQPIFCTFETMLCFDHRHILGAPAL